jgi:predicted nucleotidyltransferase
MANLYSLIPSKIRVGLLKILVLRSGTTFNINELSRLTGYSLRGVDKELKNLLSGGILLREISGNQHRYQLDPDCLISNEIKAIVAKTVGIADSVKQALASVRNEIELAFVYGSFASGDYGNESDVDLFVVSDLPGVRLSSKLGPLQQEIGRSVNTFHLSISEYRRRESTGDHFVARVLEGPKIWLFGGQE